MFEAMATDVGIQNRCGRCDTPLTERSDLPPRARPPCPWCGSLSRMFSVEMTSRLYLHSSFRARARHKTGSWFVEQIAAKDYSMSRGRWVDNVRRIDRDARPPWYDEDITDPTTGEVIHETHEPLSEHRGHGSAKRFRSAPNP
jgi:hypothetical protein